MQFLNTILDLQRAQQKWATAPHEAWQLVQLAASEAQTGIEGGADTHPGGALAALRDRIAALGGTLQVTSPPSGGTKLRGLPSADPVAAFR